MTWRHPATGITIDAPLERVWDVLLDGARYPEWNPLILEETGDSLTVGAPVDMKVRLGPFTVHPRRATVKLVLPGVSADGKAEWIHQFASPMARIGLIRSQRHHEMTPIGEHQTRYETFEDFSGPLSPILHYGWIERGFVEQSEALKARCEGGG